MPAGNPLGYFSPEIQNQLLGMASAMPSQALGMGADVAQMFMQGAQASAPIMPGIPKFGAMPSQGTPDQPGQPQQRGDEDRLNMAREQLRNATPAQMDALLRRYEGNSTVSNMISMENQRRIMEQAK